jgi:two-component system sensor histidine kinase QseC
MNGSLKSRISWLVLACLAAVLLPLVVLSYLFMMEEVDELSDARLAQNARTITALVADIGTPAPNGHEPIEIASWRREHGKQPLTVRGHSYEMQIGFQYWNDANQLLLNSENLADVPLDAAPAGFADIPIGGRHWRVFTLLADNKSWVRVGERYDSRREIARALAVEAIAPLLIGLPLLALIVAWAVQRGLAPLRALAERLADRRPDKTDPLGMADLPSEIEPVVASLNGLLGRLRVLLQHERQFTANAAHELRTPLAGALMHVENAKASTSESARTQALQQTAEGLDRLSRIVNQMLDLARWDSDAPTQALAAVDLGACVEAELQELDVRVAEKDHEIAVAIDPSARIVDGWEPGLRTLLRNLLDNAIRYGFPGGRIDISIEREGDRTRLSISDYGPGIEPALRSAMFERFRRGPEGISDGSGLGLSIVARIAELHRARIVLADADAHEGLRVDILFPPRAAART